METGTGSFMSHIWFVPNAQEAVDEGTHGSPLPDRLPSGVAELPEMPWTPKMAEEADEMLEVPENPTMLEMPGVAQARAQEAYSDGLEQFQLEQALRASIEEPACPLLGGMGAITGDRVNDGELPGQQAAADMMPGWPWGQPTPYGCIDFGSMQMPTMTPPIMPPYAPDAKSSDWLQMGPMAARLHQGSDYGDMHSFDTKPSYDEIKLRHDDSKARAESCRELVAYCKDRAQNLKAELERRKAIDRGQPMLIKEPQLGPLGPLGLPPLPDLTDEPMKVLPNEIYGNKFDEEPLAKPDERQNSGAEQSAALLELNEDDTVVGSKALGEKMGLSEGMQTPSTPVFKEPQVAHGAPLVAVGAEAMADDQFVWNVPRSKLSLTDRSIVSPHFYAKRSGESGEYAQYKAQITAIEVDAKKGGHSFKKARGHGKLEVQCKKQPSDGEPTEQVMITFEVGGEQRGPITHNFAKSSVCGLPRGSEEWDFLSRVDASSFVKIVVKMHGQKVSDKAA